MKAWDNCGSGLYKMEGFEKNKVEKKKPHGENLLILL